MGGRSCGFSGWCDGGVNHGRHGKHGKGMGGVRGMNHGRHGKHGKGMGGVRRMNGEGQTSN